MQFRLGRSRQELAQQRAVNERMKVLVREPRQPPRDPHQARRAEPTTLGPRRRVGLPVRARKDLERVDVRWRTAGGEENRLLLLEGHGESWKGDEDGGELFGEPFARRGRLGGGGDDAEGGVGLREGARGILRVKRGLAGAHEGLARDAHLLDRERLSTHEPLALPKL